MNDLSVTLDYDVLEKLSDLKSSINRLRRSALKQRIESQPHPSDLEYILGAFIQMYEPHLADFVYKLSQKGYAIDPSSGFGGKKAEFQVVSGSFSIDFITKNKLEKLGIKFRDYNGYNSLIFWPKKASLTHIIFRWKEIMDVLPDKGVLKTPSMSDQAIRFRSKYIPEHSSLQRQRLFEKLKFNIQRKSVTEIKKRIRNNPHPDTLELALGLFLEELEPQVRIAVLMLHNKGYSIDASGFMDDPCDQMIEGDFQLHQQITDTLKAIGVISETNPSGYTRIRFTSHEADFAKIKKRWNKIATLLPDKHISASPSMTRKAREFRMTYQ